MAEKLADLHVQVCYAKPEFQLLRDVTVPLGTDVQTAIKLSGVLESLPEIDLEHCKIGIYGKIKTLDTVLREHDRIEIYRPLTADPKDARRKRVQKKDGITAT